MVTFAKFNLNDYKDCLIVTDANISNLYNIQGDNVFFLPDGEQSKQFEWIERLCKWFLSKNLTRCGSVAAIGGGSIGDTVGFAASVYKRGVKLTHVPTTLVAQIDSAIGGKTAIDLDGVKNAVGTFYNADTLIDFNFLHTLDEKQLLNGMGEIIKYRMISSDVASIPLNCTEDIIAACVDCKTRLCNVDPYDVGERRILNFGHTVGHGLELTYGIPHGVAVANGLYYETLIALKLGLCSSEYFDRWANEIKAQFTLYPVTDEVISALLNDKKNIDGKIGFILPSDFKQDYLTKEQVIGLLC